MNNKSSQAFALTHQRFAILFLLCLLPGFAFGGYTIATCEHCSETARLQLALETTGNREGRVYVVNRVTEDIFPYQVSIRIESDALDIRVNAVEGEVAVLEDLQSLLQNLKSIYAQSPIEVAELEMPEHALRPASALDVSGSSTARTLLLNGVSSYLSAQIDSELFRRVPGSLVPKFFDGLTPMKVRFADGSTLDLGFDYVAVGTFSGEVSIRHQIIEHSGRDRNGDLVPERPTDLHVGFVRQADNVESWNDMLLRFGFQTENDTSFIRDDGERCMRCAWDAGSDTSKLSCARCPTQSG